MEYKTAVSFTLKDLTPYGNVYFSRYIEAQGIIRERWVIDNGLADELQKFKWITKEVNHVFKGEAVPFQAVEATLIIEEIKRASFRFKITFSQNNQELGTGTQLICFANKEGKLVGIPDEVKKRLATSL